MSVCSAAAHSYKYNEHYIADKQLVLTSLQSMISKRERKIYGKSHFTAHLLIRNGCRPLDNSALHRIPGQRH